LAAFEVGYETLGPAQGLGYIRLSHAGPSSGFEKKATETIGSPRET
jgi:hypothetical protein